jgi:isocitrate dehydrogenase (NAD+)
VNQSFFLFLSTTYLQFFVVPVAGHNVANPTAMLLASVKMLEHLGLADEAFKLKAAVNKVLEDQKVRTRDLGGFATTTQFTQAVINNF